MVDIPGNATTTSTIAVGGTASGTLEVAGDTDWFRIQLTAGQQISVILEGLTLDDPVVRIRNAAGTIIYQNDDWGEGLDSFVAFQAPSTGAYYIDVGSAPNTQTGTYQLSVAPYTPPPLGTVDDIALQLTHGFWNGDAHHFDVSVTRAITVNLTGLDAQGLAVARQALALWTDIIGVTFPEVATGGQIVFDDLNQGTGAFSESDWSNGITQWATVNVALSRLSMHTYLHEIGHALGLGHSSDSNSGTALSRYPYEAMFLNDGAAVSIMSYFDNGENSYYAGLGFTNTVIVTPQLADILAIGNLYGLSTTTRTGDTTYGFNNTSGRAVFNAAQNPNVAYTLFDSGGTDTLDYSGFFQNQLINLNAESFSNVGSGIGNVSIARGVVIENAIGGSGNDTLIGNSADNLLSGRAGTNTLTGGAGNDMFRDTTANLAGDTIVDFAFGDRIHISDANPAGFSFSLSGNILTFTGGSLTLSSVPAGRIVARAAADGGVELLVAPGAAVNARTGDFDGDGFDDILWRSDGGALGDWLGSDNGTFTINPALSHVPGDWHIIGSGDFDGDGNDDILWRHESGDLGNWLGTGDGDFQINDVHSHFELPTGWQVVGIGNFVNWDVQDELIVRDSVTGSVRLVATTAEGGFRFLHPDGSGWAAPTDWHIAGVGDFDGDSLDDILWRHESGTVSNWLSNSGNFTVNPHNVAIEVPNDWHIAGVGDFNGDGRDDILWRHENGTTGNWLGTETSGFTDNSANSLIGVPLEWQIAGVGDFNGDGRDDILWRHENGTTGNWLGTASGGYAINEPSLVHVPTDWQVQSPDSIWV